MVRASVVRAAVVSFTRACEGDEARAIRQHVWREPDVTAAQGGERQDRHVASMLHPWCIPLLPPAISTSSGAHRSHVMPATRDVRDT